MRDGNAGRLLASLEGEFQAAVVGDEEAAARDLAFSLAQDVPVTVDVSRRGGSLLLPGIRLPIEGVGHDFIVAGPWFVPLHRAVISLGDGTPPGQVAQVFVGVLRTLAREAGPVLVGLAGGRDVAGSIARANSTHLVIDGPEEIAVPLSEIAYVRRVRGGSTGAL